MKSRTLSKSGIREINTEIFQEYGIEAFEKKELVMEVIDENSKIVYLQGNGLPKFFYYEENGKNDNNDIDNNIDENENLLVPTLKYLLENNFLKKITVDMGAVKFVVSGADIMRPGICEIEDNIHEGEIIAIVDEKNKKPITIGKALFSAKDLKEQEKGKSIKNIHYIGDDIWKIGE